MNTITTFMSANPLIAAAIALAVGWLVRHKGFGGNLLPSLSGTPVVPAPKVEAMQAMAAPLRNFPSPSDVRSMIRDEMRMEQIEAPAVQSASTSPVDATHAVVQMSIDHPDQREALLPIVGALAAKAAKQG